MNESPIEFSLRQFAGAWRTMCADSPRYKTEAHDGLECVFSGVPVAFFNVGLVTGRDLTADALRATGRRACAFAADQGVPWLFITTDEALAPGTDAVAALDECGLAPMMTLTGMVADRVAPAERMPEGLALTVPGDDASCCALLDVNAAAYGMDLDAAKALMGRPDFWKRHVAVLGTADGKPVAATAVLMVDGYRYVAMVATDPGQQRKGFADATMRRALEDAARAHDECPTFLHATDAGKPVYERMGYRATTTHPVFLEKRFLEAH
jgi:GNAT superfamily N-acetyltransferase